MLQQTQVERVIPFYLKFMKQFPTAKKLAAAPLSEVLRTWQGLGYNRRAKMLHSAVEVLAPPGFLQRLSLWGNGGRGTRLNLVQKLEALPGVGSYTARAVAVFAFNQDDILIETNIRTVIIHHFFPKKKKVGDGEIEKILVQALPKGKAREWYSALMDYGAHLKRSGISHNAKSKTYVKQTKFAGSLREARGAILRALAQGAVSSAQLINLLGVSRRVQMREALRALWTEGLVKKDSGGYTLSD